MTRLPQTCPLCEKPEQAYDLDREHLTCTDCGNFKLTLEAQTALHPNSPTALLHHLRTRDVVAELRIYIHDENAAGRIPEFTPSQLELIRPLPVIARTDRLLARIAALLDRPKAEFRSDQHRQWALGAYDAQDLLGLSALLAEQKLIDRELTNGGGSYYGIRAFLTAAGWARVAELAKTSGTYAFIAMSFTAEMLAIADSAIRPAIVAAGYQAILVSDREHNDHIDDRIEYEIKNCHFIVADFTDRKGGVYYEAGFAKGLGKPVIWAVHKRDVKRLHFDTRQFNHIVWTEAVDLRRKLEARILNTVGKGPSAKT